MIRLTNYQISEQLYESGNSLVYRAMRESDNQPVIIKTLREARPERIAWFKREYQVTRDLDIPGVVSVYELSRQQNRWLMTLEDFAGDSLKRLALAGQFELPDFLTLAICVVDILAQVHQRHILAPAQHPYHLDRAQPAALASLRPSPSHDAALSSVPPHTKIVPTPQDC